MNYSPCTRGITLATGFGPLSSMLGVRIGINALMLGDYIMRCQKFTTKFKRDYNITGVAVAT